MTTTNNWPKTVKDKIAWLASNSQGVIMSTESRGVYFHTYWSYRKLDKLLEAGYFDLLTESLMTPEESRQYEKAYTHVFLGKKPPLLNKVVRVEVFQNDGERTPMTQYIWISLDGGGEA